MFTKHTPPCIPSATKITMKWALVSGSKMATKGSLNHVSMQENTTCYINMPIIVFFIDRNTLSFNFPKGLWLYF